MSNQPQEHDSKVAPDNVQVAKVLARMAGLLEFKDENLFKVRSYQMASETVSGMQDSVADIATRGGAALLQKIPGIGKSISAQIVEIVNGGTCSYFESLKSVTPESVLELRRISGIGLKTAQLLYNDFGIKSLEELRQFAEGGGLTSVRGLGEKTAKRIANSLARIQSTTGTSSGIP
jgi:DNA polymerase (family 10)